LQGRAALLWRRVQGSDVGQRKLRRLRPSVPGGLDLLRLALSPARNRPALWRLWLRLWEAPHLC
jgi:hypothetical protein